MADKQKKQDELSSDELLDQLAAEAGVKPAAEESKAEEKAEDSQIDTKAGLQGKKGKKAKTNKKKPAEPEELDLMGYYQKSIDLLKPHGQGEIDLSEDVQKEGKSHGLLNFFLVLLILGVACPGFYYFYTLSNEEALDLRRARNEERKQIQLEEQLAKQKRYGIMRIESDPPQAFIFKNGKQIIAPQPGAAACEDDSMCGDGLACDLESKHCGVPARTPTNISDVNIVQVDKYVLELPGYEPFDFHVSEHLWTKDMAGGDYRLLKVIDMNELPCEYWFIFDSTKGEEQKYETRRLCDKAYKEAKDAQLSVTDCTCKALPEPAPEGAAAPAETQPAQ